MDGRETRPVSCPEWERKRSTPRPPECQKTLGGGRQGLGGGVQLPRGNDNPGVKELPQGDKTSRVTFEGNGVPEVDRQGQGGDRNYLATWDTEGATATRCRVNMVSGQEPVAPPSASRGTVEGGRRG